MWNTGVDKTTNSKYKTEEMSSKSAFQSWDKSSKYKKKIIKVYFNHNKWKNHV